MSTSSSNSNSNTTVRIYGAATILGLIAFVVTLQFVEPAPPRNIKLATGRAGGAYQSFGVRIQEQLAKAGITVEIAESAGSIDNLGRLGRGEVDLAFVQGGVKGDLPADSFRAIASVYYEPLWVFHRAEVKVGLLSELEGRKICVGAEGSGTRSVALSLLKENGIAADAPGLSSVGGMAAAAALMNGEVDAVFVVGATTDAAVRTLMRAEGVTLLDFVRAEAYTRRHRFLSSVTLPRGAFDPLADLPRATTRLVAPTAQLVVGEGFHPALVDLILDAAEHIFTRGDLVQAEREFPSAKYVDYELSPIATRYFKNGRPFLYRYLPFLLAAFLDRMKILLLPLLTLIFPLVKLIPPVYRWRTRSRIYRWYKDLLRIETGAQKGLIADPIAELGQLELDVAELTVPASYTDELYHLKHHIELVRERLRGDGVLMPSEDSASTVGSAPAEGSTPV